MSALLDNVFEFKTNNNSDFVNYLNYWEKKARYQSIVIPEGIDAVKIMTIHKAKGLEFPVVVIPFAADELSNLGSRKVWYPIAENFDTSFEWARINFSNKLKYLGKEGEDFYFEKVNEERMDALNTFYVALTRAVTQVYLITNLEDNKLSADKSYATLLNKFVRIKGNEPSVEQFFQWGAMEKDEALVKDFGADQIHPKFKMDYEWQNRLWTQLSFKYEKQVENNRQEGILIHDLMSEVNHEEEVNSVIENALVLGRISQPEKVHYTKLLLTLVNHPDLKAYFEKDLTIYNEQDILVPEQSFVRPDRIVKTASHWAIIDYKTGKYNVKHESQINKYSEIICEMTQAQCKKFLVYIDEKIWVKLVH